MAKARYHYNIMLRPEPEGGYTALVPALPGCVTHGRTLEEARAMAKDAISGYIEAPAKSLYPASAPRRKTSDTPRTAGSAPAPYRPSGACAKSCRVHAPGWAALRPHSILLAPYWDRSDTWHAFRFLHKFRSPQIMQMHNPVQLPASIDNHQRSNLLLFHQRQRSRGKLTPSNRLGIASHSLPRRKIQHILPALLQQPPQIPIADNAHQLRTLYHCRHA